LAYRLIIPGRRQLGPMTVATLFERTVFQTMYSIAIFYEKDPMMDRRNKMMVMDESLNGILMTFRPLVVVMPQQVMNDRNEKRKRRLL
jgi:hypothetical protein